MKVRDVFIHGNNLAVNIKNTPIPLDDIIMQRHIFGRTITEDERNEIVENELSFWDEGEIAELFIWIETTMQAAFPGHNIKVEQTGRSGGWLEISGRWSLESVRALDPKVSSFMAITNEPMYEFNYGGSYDLFYIPRDEENLDLDVGRRIIPVFVALVQSAQREYYDWVAHKMRGWWYEKQEKEKAYGT